LKIERVPPPQWGERLLPEWNRLLGEASEPSVFLSPDWVIAWQRHFGPDREAFLLTARDESGNLAGLAPLYRRRLGPQVLRGPRVLSFLGDEGVGSEYLGILARRGSERAVVSALAQDLEGEWVLADLRGLRTGFPGTDLMISALGAQSPDRVHRERHPCSSIPLPGDYEAYLAFLHPKFRTAIRHRTKRLAKNFAVRLILTTRQEELEGHLGRFFEMHQDRWVAEGYAGSFYHPRKRNFYREASAAFLRRGWLRFYHLEVDGVIRAAQYGIAYGGVLHSLQDAFDSHFRPEGARSIGVVLRGMAIRESIVEGLRAYDFLGGEEEFKTRWGTATHFVERARIGAPGPAGGFAYLCTAEMRDARLWIREHLPEWVVEARDRFRVRREARRARQLPDGPGENPA